MGGDWAGFLLQAGDAGKEQLCEHWDARVVSVLECVLIYAKR